MGTVAVDGVFRAKPGTVTVDGVCPPGSNKISTSKASVRAMQSPHANERRSAKKKEIGSKSNENVRNTLASSVPGCHSLFGLKRILRVKSFRRFNLLTF